MVEHSLQAARSLTFYSIRKDIINTIASMFKRLHLIIENREVIL